MCGCVYITTDIEITPNNNWNDINTPLVESNFSFLYYIKDIRGYLIMRDIPQIERLSFPNLIIIRGEVLFSGSALATFNSNIRNLYMPQLTEITKGDVLFTATNNYPSVCNIMNINWNDILSDNYSATFTGMEQSCSDSSELHSFFLQCIQYHTCLFYICCIIVACTYCNAVAVCTISSVQHV